MVTQSGNDDDPHQAHQTHQDECLDGRAIDNYCANEPDMVYVDMVQSYDTYAKQNNEPVSVNVPPTN